MTIANGGFEIEGTALGTAAEWTSVVVSSLEEWADWAQNPGDGATLPQEGFEKGWTGVAAQAFVSAFQGPTIDLEDVVFNAGPGQGPVEMFERNWPALAPPDPTRVHSGFLGSLLATEAAMLGPAGAAETFESGWGTVVFTMPATSTGMFNGQPFEDLEGGWHGNEAWSDDINDFSVQVAQFGMAGALVEDFNAVATPESVRANTTTNELTLLTTPALAIADNDPVAFMTSDALPAPLQVDVVYYITSKSSATTFKLLAYLGGAAIDLTTEGSGIHSMARDPRQWWTRILSV